MKYISARAVKNSDFQSTDFIRLNNCGAFIDTAKEINTRRTNGRKDYQLIYISHGCLNLTLDEKEVVLGKGNIILFRPCEPQIYRSVLDTSFYWIHFSGSEVERMLSFFDKQYFYIGNFSAFEEFCIEAAGKFAADLRSAELYCAGRLVSLIALIADEFWVPKNKTYRAMLEPAIVYMHTNFDKWCSNDEYAKMCNMSKSHFIRTFHEAFGKPPKQYRAEILVAEAKRLLKSGFSVSAVAECFGFDDAFYFSRMFKKHAGISPSDYRRAESETVF